MSTFSTIELATFSAWDNLNAPTWRESVTDEEWKEYEKEIRDYLHPDDDISESEMDSLVYELWCESHDYERMQLDGGHYVR